MGFDEECKGICNINKCFIAEPFKDLSTEETTRNLDSFFYL